MQLRRSDREYTAFMDWLERQEAQCREDAEQARGRITRKGHYERLALVYGTVRERAASLITPPSD